jgi:uncharacterized membrane protein YeaQ/YmgE (transglycosylase-associated protein family)
VNHNLPRLSRQLDVMCGGVRFLEDNGMNIINLIISLVSGAVGGNVAGAAMKEKSLGTAGNSVAGILGGGIGGTILQALGLGGEGSSVDLASILQSIASGGVGGGVLLAIVSAVKGMLAKKATKA